MTTKLSSSIINNIKLRQSNNTTAGTYSVGSGTSIFGVPIGQTITLSSLPSTLTLSASDSFSDMNSNGFVTKHEYLVIKEDLLAMSCARHRMEDNTSLLNEEIAKQVIPEDRERADKIRKYYSAKCIFWTLKEQELTEFRRDLYTFINTTGMQFEEKMVKLAYRLPEFYEYDIEFDSIKDEHDLVKSFPDSNSTEFKPRPNRYGVYASDEDTRKLTAIKVTHRNTKNKKLIEYWLKDEENYLCLISIDPMNSLKPLWDKEYAKGTLVIHGHYFAKLRNDFPCYDLKRWKIIE